tara:strand:+ start:135 stop:500 length:366 start_codon:yes stop_codon:yes gene_type:complete
MKSSELKKLIKTAVREAIQEELKDILLEAVKAPTVMAQPIGAYTPAPQIVENQNPLPPQQPTMSAEEKRSAYKNILGDTAATLTSNNVPQSFNPQQGFDSSNGTLPQGEVDMSQISGLMNR